MMITVNLRPGSKKAKSGPSLASGLAWTKGLASSTLDPLRLVAMAAWIAVVGFLGWSFLSTGSQLGELEPRVAELRAEQVRFQDFLAQKRREELVRDSILAQVQTIRTVDGERFVWPHILDEVARALPPFTWLVDLGPAGADPRMAQVARAVADTAMVEPPKPVEVQLTGRTVDIQGYTRFMRALEDSPFLGNVQAVSASTVVEQGRAVTAFVLKTTYTKPDAARLRTVPVAESVVR
ncbi:MAG TPA: PilN domain-containing protein [Gemmatimonadales bacterium]